MRLGIEAGEEAAFTRTVTERDLLLTAEVTGDHDPLHVDEAYAATTAYGRRIAHGALVLGLLSTTASTIAHRAIANGAEGVPVSLGYDRVRFLRPVFIGDTLRAETSVHAVKPSGSRPNAGIVTFEHRLLNQRLARHILKWVAG